MRYIKALGLAMLAAFALSAVAASGAVANEETPKPNPEIGFAPTTDDNVGLETITAGPQDFRVTGETSFFRCTEADFSSHEDFPNETEHENPLTVVPDFETNPDTQDCFAQTAFGKFNVIVDENKCDLELFAQTHNEGAGDFEGDAYVDCTTSEVGHIQITIPAVGCTFKVGTNNVEPVGTADHPITYTNVQHSGIEAVTVEVEGEVTYTHTGGFCSGPAEGEAVYTGHAVVGGIDTDTGETADVGVTTIG